MKTRRRIEITAFRRATVVFGDRSEDISKSHGLCETKRSKPVPEPPPEAVDFAENMLAAAPHSTELTLLIDALLKNNGNDARAAKELGLSRDEFLSKLCALGLNVK